jgi:hypothetical protein
MRTVLVAAAVLLIASAEARAQTQTVNEVLSFLLTNRSIPTDDFVRDAEAAETTRATIARFLQLELGTVPIASSASGFTYRMNRALGAVERTSDSFGPFFVNRSLTLGDRQIALSVAYQDTSFGRLDGRSLRDGTLVSTASQLAGEAVPFDVETLTLRVRTRATAISANVGVTDRLDVGVTVPFVTLSMDGERVDTYRGRESVQAAASAVVTGLSDVLLRGKYNVLREGGSGVAVGADLRLPTGNADNLLGAGEATIGPRVVGSIEYDRMALHGDAGFVVGGATKELNLGAAVTYASTPRLTLVGELSGRWLASLGRLVDSVQPHPALVGVQTLRLTSNEQGVGRIGASAGFKWNIASTWLLSGHLSRPLTDPGLTAGWVPTFTLDYLVGR